MKQSAVIAQLLSRYPLISDQISRPALATVLTQLDLTLQRAIEGDVVELGCYIGTTTLFLRRLLDTTNQSDTSRIFAYDSFTGLPPKTNADASGTGEQFQGGELSVTKKQFLHEFYKANLKPPITIKGWFNDLTPEQLPETIAFAFLDGDFYASILDSLRLVWPRLAVGGVITIDDYQREALPGVERAVRDFFQGKAIELHHEHHIAVIQRR